VIFSVTPVNLINMLFIAAGVGVCGLCFMQITSSVHLRKEVRRYFQFFFLLIIVYISAHLARQLMDGLPGTGVRTALYIVTFLEMLAAGCMAHMISLLVIAVAKLKNAKPVLIVLGALLTLHTALLIVGWCSGMIYTFDENNVYQRAPLYVLSNVCPLAMLLIDVVVLLRCCKDVDRRVKSAFWVYMIAPLAAIVIQSAFYGVQLIIFATVGAAVYMFSVIVQNQNAAYEKQQVESSRIETELTMASSIQADMLPSIYPAFPERPEFDIFASMDPAKEVGGDFYDFFLVDEDHLALVMADVSGKGVPAALFMMASKIIIANNTLLGKSPAKVLTDANNAICANNREGLVVTVWLGILDMITGKVVAANAGHERPAVMHAGGDFELIDDPHGLAIGGIEGMKYKEHEFTLNAGDKLFLYTDGVPEATNAEEKLFGKERMLEALNAVKDETPQGVLKGVRRSVDGFVQQAEQFDDLTMLCVVFRGHEEATAE
jgi:serine phosphatase RsbU (regulator of sigma subunit)